MRFFFSLLKTRAGVYIDVFRNCIGLSEDLIVNSLIAAPPSGHHKSCIYLIY